MEKEYFCNHAGTEEDPCECKFEKEFNLESTDKKIFLLCEEYHQAKLKEFIKDLKEEIINKNAKFGSYSLGDVGRDLAIEIINKLARDKLI